MEDHVSKKRPASVLNEPENGKKESPSKKRNRLERTLGSPAIHTNFLPTPRKSGCKTFLFLHLQILRALYGDPIDCNDKIHTMIPEDGETNEELWGKIQTFLKEREQLREMADNVRSVRGVHEEAVAFMKEQKEIASTMASPWMINGGIPNVFGSRTLFSSQPSPHHHHHYPPNFSLSVSHPDEGVGEGGCFGLIAGLLKRKCQIAESNLRIQTNPFRPLLKDVSSRIETLEGLLNGLKNFPTEHEDTDDDSTEMDPRTQKSVPERVLPLPTNDQNEEVTARRETKLRLWKMLLLDLKSS